MQFIRQFGGQTNLGADHRTTASKTAATTSTSGQATATLLALLFPLTGVAQIIADHNAPKTQRPTVLTTANGLPQVNIQTPSAAGVSRNTYSQFDVTTRGVILNNSRVTTRTQLGGLVQGNPWLATGSARVILNEVNSSAPSQLRGYVEVAGPRTEVIIANPAGISVNGGGFLNASSVTLSTGSTILHAGNLAQYQVRGGNIRINGAGLDTRSTDYTQIVARAAQVNAGIWAKELKVITGFNDVTATGVTNPVTAPRAADSGSALSTPAAPNLSLPSMSRRLGACTPARFFWSEPKPA